MKICINCDLSTDDMYTYCPSCGRTLISSDESLMKDFLEHCDSYKVNFIEFMEKVIRIRGHGSNVNIDVSDKDFYEINREFLFIFKSFVEFFK